MITVIDDNDGVPLFPSRERGYERRDYSHVPYGSIYGTKTFDISLIPRAQWPERIQRMQQTRSRLSDFAKARGVPVLDQDGLPYCHGFCIAGAVMVLRAVRGLGVEKLSGSSVAGPAVGFRRQGQYIGKDIEIAAQYGVAPTSAYPEISTDAKSWARDDVRKASAEYRIVEWYELEANNFDQVMTCLLLRIPVVVGLDWWGHAVYYCDPVQLNDGRFGVLARNSWGPSYGDDGWFVLSEKKATPGEAYAPRVLVG